MGKTVVENPRGTVLRNIGELTDWKETLSNEKGEVRLPVALDSVLKSKLLTVYFEHSLFFEMLNPNLIERTQTATKFIKNPGSSSRLKGDVIGPGDLGTWTTGDVVEVKFKEPLVQTEAIRAIDLHFGIQPRIEAKMRKMMEHMSEEFETYAFNKVENSIKPDKTIEFYFDEMRNASRLNGNDLLKELRRLLIRTATKIRKTKDKKQGISFLKKSDIIIFVQDEILDDLAEVGLLGDRVTETYAKGATSVTEIGGYKILPNPYLDKFDAIITTKFAGAGDVIMIAAQFDKIGISADMAVYLEYTFAAGMLYDNITYGIKIGEQRPKDTAVSEVVTKTEGSGS